ncbi:flagellin [Pseudorhodobacter sp.]|uniref:flagellin n=1 Tax=Pseudorhodobacter sp. TaxID=1934400 RepID=UPI002647098E|nr:flagellin [Pseudorhodobacter sp.]MDN5786484.1 flagellar biosynthesis protein FlgL [Pseudorhodobacter sp.]
MALISLGDMAQNFMLRRMTSSLKLDARIAAQELTSGRTADSGKALRGDHSRLAGIETSLNRLNGYRSATDAAALTAGAQQQALGVVDRLTDGLAISLLDAETLHHGGMLNARIADATERFEAVISALNTRQGEKTLFAGIASDTRAVAPSGSILTAVETAISAAGAVSAADIELAVDNWFNASGGFAALGYTGGASQTPISVSAEDKADLAITAADPALRDTLKSLTLAALAGRPSVAPNADTRVDLARRAGGLLLQANSDRAVLSGRLGVVQARIDQAQTRNQAESTALQMARSDLLSVEPYEAATRMEAAQNQLETLYSVTARLSRLSLVDFLR